MSEENGTAKPFKYSRRLATRDVEIEEDDGSVKTYQLRELPAPKRADYRNFVASRLDKDNRIKDSSGIEEKLVAMCLYDPEGKPVPFEVVKTFGASMCSALYEECAEMNALTAKGEDAAKKA